MSSRISNQKGVLASFLSIFLNLRRNEKILLFFALLIIVSLILFSLIGKAKIRIDPLRSGHQQPAWGKYVVLPEYQIKSSSNPCQEKRFEKYVNIINKLQFPSDCQANNILVYQFKGDNRDFGAQIRSALVAIDWALTHQRTFIFRPDDDWAFLTSSQLCPPESHSHNCFFLPPSNCSLENMGIRSLDHIRRFSGQRNQPEDRILIADSLSFGECKSNNPLCVGLPEDWHKCPNDPSDGVMIAQWSSLFLHLILQPNEDINNFVEERKKSILYSHPITGVLVEAHNTPTDAKLKKVIGSVKKANEVLASQNMIINMYLSVVIEETSKKFHELAHKKFRVLEDPRHALYQNSYCQRRSTNQGSGDCTIDFAEREEFNFEAILVEQIKDLRLLYEAEQFIGTKQSNLALLVRAMRFSPWDHRPLEKTQLVDIE